MSGYILRSLINILYNLLYFQNGLLSGAPKPSFCIYLLQITYDECRAYIGVHQDLPYMLDCYSCSTRLTNFFFSQHRGKFVCLGRCAAYYKIPTCRSSAGKKWRRHEEENWFDSFELCLSSCVLRQKLLDVGTVLPSTSLKV